ncbi:ER membrane protein complex subunit 1, putative [Plasmodium sp. gorilla clade G1]|nr:ER membrane protein complex subunit 1, putative [Plasmodium sp. gorilla clade G1]
MYNYKLLFHAFIYGILSFIKICYGNYASYSNNTYLIGHVNNIIPIPNKLDNLILLSSYDGVVGLLNYKTGKLELAKYHREYESVKKLYGDDKYAAALIYKNNYGSDLSEDNIVEEEDMYNYINVYDINNFYLLSSFEYNNKEIINDFIIKGQNIYILLKDKIDIGNINDNSVISISFKELKLDLIYIKIINVKDDKIINLFYVDVNKNSYIGSLNILTKKLNKIKKIKQLHLTNNTTTTTTTTNNNNNNNNNYYYYYYYNSSIYNNNVVIIYNYDYLYWIELLNDENEYYYNYISIKDKMDKSKISKANHINKNFITNDYLENCHVGKYICISKEDNVLIYNYDNKKMNFVEKKNQKNQVIGYYLNKENEKVMIIGEDTNKNILIKKINNDKKNILLQELKKSNNIYYNPELLIGIYNKEENVNYFFSIYNDLTLTAYKNNNVYFTREESLIYIEQLYFYNFQHLKKPNNTTTGFYTPQFHIAKEIEGYIKDKLNLFSSPYVQELKKKKQDNSLLPFFFFHLSKEDKMNLLNICTLKKDKSDSFIINKKKLNNEKDNYTKLSNQQHMKDKSNYEFMNSLVKNSFDKYASDLSSKYAGSSIILVSTYNNFIYAIHLYTGLILYKIDTNVYLKNDNLFDNKTMYRFPIITNENNWSEIDNAKKLIFYNYNIFNNNNNNNNKMKGKKNSSSNINNTDNNTNIILNDNSVIDLFKGFSKDTVITILKNNNNPSNKKDSHILIFDVLNGDIIYEKKVDSFYIKNYFILKNTFSLITVDESLNTKVIHMLNNSPDLNINDEELYFYQINKTDNFIQGYRLIISDRKKRENIDLIKTYSINLNNENVELFSKSITKKDIFFPIKINKDASICYKYINDNIVSYITSSKNKTNKIYTLYIIDGISGKLLFSRILDKYVNPPFHLIINENKIILNYYHKNIHKNVFHIIEILLDKPDPGFFNLITSKKQKVVNLFDEENIVINETNYIIDHNVKSFNFTETKRGITNKHLLLLLDTNKIAYLPFSNDKNTNIYKNLNTFITHTDILYNSRGFISNESLLESTTLIFSWGNNLYFTSYQPNGSFDTIEKFSLLLLLFLIFLVFVGTYISYNKRINKKLYAKWE